MDGQHTVKQVTPPATGRADMPFAVISGGNIVARAKTEAAARVVAAAYNNPNGADVNLGGKMAGDDALLGR